MSLGLGGRSDREQIRPDAPLSVVGAAILRETRCLVARRGPGMDLTGRWEFPGGKRKRGESPKAALARELREELGVEITVGAWLGRGESFSHGRPIVLDAYLATIAAGELTLREHAAVRWISADEIDGLDWAEADRPMLPILRRVLERGREDRPLFSPVPILSVDWSKHPASRVLWLALAQVERGTKASWMIERPSLPPAGWDLASVLALAEEVSRPFGGSALVAIDAVLGLPSTLGARIAAGSFPEAIGRRMGDSSWIFATADIGVSGKQATQERPAPPAPTETNASSRQTGHENA